MNNVFNFDYDVFKLSRDDSGKLTRNYVNTDHYYFRTYPGLHLLTIEKNGVKFNFTVKDDPSHIYFVQKTQIKAKDGAAGLIRFFMNPEWRDHVVHLIDKIILTVKEAAV